MAAKSSIKIPRAAIFLGENGEAEVSVLASAAEARKRSYLQISSIFDSHSTIARMLQTAGYQTKYCSIHLLLRVRYS